jgi:hypothetical protein
VPDIINDGNVRIHWVTTLSSTTSPTATQINAGVDITAFITPDGYNVATSEASVDTGALNSVDDTSLPGRRSDEIEITFKNQGDSAAPWTTFASTPAGFIVERRGVAYATAIAASQKVRVFPVTAGFRNKITVTPNEVEKFSVKFYKTAATSDAATVA